MSAPTIMDVCLEQSWPYPVTDDELAAFIRQCERLGIRTNCSSERWWKEYAR